MTDRVITVERLVTTDAVSEVVIVASGIEPGHLLLTCTCGRYSFNHDTADIAAAERLAHAHLACH